MQNRVLGVMTSGMNEAERSELQDSEIIRQGFHASNEIPTRAGWNPLRGLTARRVAHLLEAAETGYLADLTWLYRFVEKREPITATLTERRDSALGSCVWSIKAEEEAESGYEIDQVLLAEQSAALREAFGAIDNLNEAWRWLGKATFRGFAHLEMHTDALDRVVHLEPVPQWFFGLAYPRRQWVYNADAQNSNRGTPIPEEWWVVREVDTPIDEIASVMYVGRMMGWSDWQLYVSRHGVPNIFLQTSTEAAASRADYEVLKSMLTSYVSGGKGVLPPGVTANVFGSGQSSQNTPFPGLMDYIDKVLVLRGTGGKLTMLSEATGIGSGATGAHEAVFSEIATSEAKGIAEILHKAIGAPVLDRAFPGMPQLARFAITKPSAVNAAQTATTLATLKNAGWIVSREKASDMLGFEVEEAPEAPAFEPQITPLRTQPLNLEPVSGNREGDATDSGAGADAGDADEEADGVKQSLVDGMKPILQAAIDALGIEDEVERKKALQKLKDELPSAMQGDDGEIVRAFETILATAFAEGVRVGMPSEEA